jgi:hypothetical protein
MKTKISEINSAISSKVSLLICSGSFEERWFQIAKNIKTDDLSNVLILQRGYDGSSWERGITELDRVHKNKMRILDIPCRPSELWKFFSSDILPLIKEQKFLTLIDITTLTHETVVMFVSLIKAEALSDKVILAYAGAKAYFISDDKADWWLSRGVKDIRSILGFPGLIRPSKKSHLVILVGFETERAKELIVQYEPVSISLGIGVDPYSQEFYEKNNWFKEQLQIFIDSVGGSVKMVSEFQFSCSDFESAKSAILTEASKFSDFNITIAPMNTKVSTVAVACAAIENEALKLCYVEPVEYNKDYYSSPGDALTIIKI